MNSQGMTLYSGPLSMFGAKVQIAALEKALDFELVMVHYTSEGYSPKHPEVLRINPKARTCGSATAAPFSSSPIRARVRRWCSMRTPGRLSSWAACRGGESMTT